MIVSELVARLGLHVDEASINRTDDAFKRVRQGLLGLGAAFAGAVAGLATLVQKTAEAGDRFDKASQSIGLSAEALQELVHAADLSGASFQQLQTGLRILSNNARQAGLGAEEFSRAFREAGVSVKGADGELRPVDEILADIATKFESMPDGTQKTALSIKLLGESGATLIPLLNSGAGGIAEMRREARDLGLVLDQEAVTASARFVDETARVKGSLTGLRNAIAGPLIEDATRLGEALRGIIQDLRKTVAPDIVAGLKKMAGAVAWLAENLWLLKAALTTLVAYKLAMLWPTLELIIWSYTKLGIAALAAGGKAWAGSVLAAAGAALVQMAWAAAIAALVLLLQDLYTWATGGDSMIGRLIGSWDQFYEGLLSNPDFEKNSPVLAFLVKVLDKVINVRREVGKLLDSMVESDEKEAQAKQNKDTARKLALGGKSAAQLAELAGNGPRGAGLGLDAFMYAIQEKAAAANAWGMIGEDDMRAQLAEVGVSGEEFDAWWRRKSSGGSDGREAPIAPPSVMAMFGGGASPDATVAQSGAGAQASVRIDRIEQTVQAAPGQNAQEVGAAASASLADALQGPLQEAAAAIRR